MEKFDLEAAMKRLRQTLKPERYEHSVGVMETAVLLAKRFGADTEKAKIAGILHDCAKNISDDESYKLCRKYGIELDEVSKKSVKPVHQYLGAALARAEFGICDEEILSAIACHTTGKAAMSTLDKIIYLADFIEPSRDKEPFEGLHELRKLCKKDLDEAMIYALEISITSIAKRTFMINMDTVCAWNWFLEEKLEKTLEKCGKIRYDKRTVSEVN